MALKHSCFKPFPAKCKGGEDLVLWNQIRNQANTSKHVFALALQAAKGNNLAFCSQIEHRFFESIKTRLVDIRDPFHPYYEHVNFIRKGFGDSPKLGAKAKKQRAVQMFYIDRILFGDANFVIPSFLCF